MLAEGFRPIAEGLLHLGEGDTSLGLPVDLVSEIATGVAGGQQ
jgi:hypothetical protein